MFIISINEGYRILEERIVKGYKIIDNANLAGMNTPGPFGAGKKNYKKYCSLLNELADTTEKEYFKLCNLMETGEFLDRKKMNVFIFEK